MKFKYLILSAVAALSFSSASGLLINLVQAGEMSSPRSESEAMVKEAGTFVAAEHPTQGMARIVSDSGKRYLEFDRAFKSDEGPDLHVILHRDASLPKGGLKEQDYVILSRLQKVSGKQRYAIPQNVNLVNYRSVAIWCRQFNATFGYAPLQNSDRASQ
jgi:Electron transfer DM13